MTIGEFHVEVDNFSRSGDKLWIVHVSTCCLLVKLSRQTAILKTRKHSQKEGGRCRNGCLMTFF